MTSFTSRSPGVIRTLDTGAGLIIPPVEDRERTSLIDLAQAAFERENIIGSLIAKANKDRPIGPVDPNFEVLEITDPTRRHSVTDNPFVHVAGYEEFLLEFLDARNPDDVQRIKRNIQRELRNREILFDSGAVGFMAAMAGALLDPLIFVPGVGIVKGARGATSIIRTAVKSAALGGGIIGTQELALQVTQRTRTPTESIINVTGGAVLTGILGAAIGKLTSKQVARAASDLDDLVKIVDAPTAKDEFSIVKAQEKIDTDSTTTAVEVGAAQGVTLEKASFFGLDFNKLQKRINPRIQLIMSKLGLTRGVAERLIDIPGRIKGDPIRSRSAEIEMRVRRAEARNVQLQVRELYARYLSGDPGRQLGVKNVLFGFGRRTDKISERQFREEIAKALRGQAAPDGKTINIDIHEIPEVEAAAKLYRNEIINPIRDELIELGVLPPEIRDFPGYLTRLYNRDLFRKPGERELFIDAVIGYRQKIALQTGKITDFDEAGTRIALGKVVDKIVALPEGRLFPGDTPYRGPMLERTLDVPDVIIARWLENDTERIITSYVRTLVGDVEIIKRFGLAVEREAFEEARVGLIAAIRAAKTQREAAKLIDEFRGGLIKRGHGGKKFSRVLRQGSKRRGISKPAALAKRIREAKSTEDATTILRDQDTKLLSEYSTGNMELVLDRVESLWNRRISDASKTSAKEAVKLKRQRNNDLANLRLSRDEIRGLATLPEDPTFWLPRTLKVLRQWTVMAVGGKIAISSIPDLSLPILNHGIADPRGFGKFLGAMLGDWNKIRLAKEDAKLALGPSELYTNARSAQLFDIADDFHPRTRIERGVASATHAFSLANLMGPWNQAMRTISSAIVMQLIIRSARTIAGGGALSKLARGRLAELGLGDDMLKRIFAQFQEHGGKGTERGGARIDMAPNIGEWTDLDVKRSFQAAVYRAYDLNIIKGGVLDRPKLLGKQNIPGMGDELSKTVFFFLNFGLSANARILGRGLQFRDAAFASGATLSVALGILSQWIKWQASGRKDPPTDTVAGWVKLGVEQSGVSGFMFDVDRILEALSGGKLASSRFIPTFGGPRFFDVQRFEQAIFGLPIGTAIGTIATAGDIAISLDADPDDIRRLRRIIPMQNLFWASRIFDAIQEKGERLAR